MLRGGRETPITLVSDDSGRTLHKADTAASGATRDVERLHRLPRPALIEPRLVVTGMFTYMADAAAITLCADGGRLPVAMEGDYRALEAAYLRERRDPGQALLVSVEGLIAPRPSAEVNRRDQVSLVVERFINVWPRESCGNPLVDQLRLRRMGGTMVACLSGMEQEQRFLQSIEGVERYRISGSHLEMLDAAGEVVARFEAVALR